MELETIAKVPVERLRLDRRNPRLHGESEMASDEELVAWLYRAAALGELLQSISVGKLMSMGGTAQETPPASRRCAAGFAWCGIQPS